MKPCGHCGAELADDASFCNECWRTVVVADTVGPDGPPPSEPGLGGAFGAAETERPGEPPSGAPVFQAPLGAPTAVAQPPAPEFPSAPPPPPPSPWQEPETVVPAGWPESGSAATYESQPPTQDAWLGPPSPGGSGAGPYAYPPPPGANAYGQAPPSYVGTYGGYGYVGYQPLGTNGMAIASLVCSLLGVLCGVPAILGVIFGHVALSQIKRTGEEGRGLAIAGLIVGYLAMVLWAFWLIRAVATTPM